MVHRRGRAGDGPLDQRTRDRQRQHPLRPEAGGVKRQRLLGQPDRLDERGGGQLAVARLGPQEQQPDRERIGPDLVAQPPAVVQHREARRQLRDLVQKADLLARRAAEPLARDLQPRGGMDEPQDDLHRTLVGQETAAKHEIGRFARLASLVVDHVQLAQ